MLALTVHTLQQPINSPSSKTEFKDFVLRLTASTARQSHEIVRQIPTAIIRSQSSSETPFKLIYSILEDENLALARDSAIAWLKDELLRSSGPSPSTLFQDPHYFWALFPALFNPVSAARSSDLVASWICLNQTRGPPLHSALNLYYLLLSSPSLRSQLQLGKTVKFFRGDVLNHLRDIFHKFEADLTTKGGEGVIEAAVGEEVCQIGNARSAALIGLTLDGIEHLINELFGSDDADLETYSGTDEAQVDKIRKQVYLLE